VSPWVTISRRNVERCSPGTCCHTGWPKWSPKPTRTISFFLRQKNPPAVIGHFYVSNVAQPLVSTLIAVRR